MSLAHGEIPADTVDSNAPPAEPQYSIIVPAYNERLRIGVTLQRLLDHLREQRWNAEILVVDDGSRDDTAQIVDSFAAAHAEVRLIRNPGNCGKGYAVRNGMLQARGNLLLFTDADLSSPIGEAAKLFATLEGGADVAIGSRWLDPSLQLKRQPLKRRFLSRLFNIFLRTTLGLSARDTQCGFKAFTRQAANMLFPLQQIHRFGFDPEILYLAHGLGLKVAEIPVIWRHDDRSTVNLFRDGMRTGVDVLRVCWYSLAGTYSTPAQADHDQVYAKAVRSSPNADAEPAN
ncbi:MAG TPA: dolichyl-phosphate beta-glucosyltransferase [Verrucomicrobiae bacterium]|jgi:dolichyl-phosphate beta-glucosyltransferase|nr:dolichyl-phosphate beta-glucosyltransferase [Verrucomicrobiae bacterium]